MLGVLQEKHAQFLFQYHLHFDSIASLSQDKKGDYFYDDLRERYEEGDTSMTSFDMLALIIGETQQDHYYPYELIPVEQEIMQLANKGEYANALYKCDSVLMNHPLNFTAILHKAFLEDKLGSLTAKKSKFKFVLYLDVILSTGDGTYQAPIMVLGPGDGQLLVRYVFGAGVGNMGSGEDAYGNFVDILEVLKEGEEPTNMYFNIEHAVLRMFKEDVVKKFEKAYKKEQKKAKKKKKEEKD
ncbi:hypothetical protein CRYO30217_02148 [Parvicella tangerina]|uniref:Uncharacterized protein n=1 Tax=Parvicella tangerina TaxID=2829795 RepID=A0A916NCJ9_9FLAO|nr:hypothetical protein CRYO30217_02148 [Parvicella tangerina]